MREATTDQDGESDHDAPLVVTDGPTTAPLPIDDGAPSAEGQPAISVEELARKHGMFERFLQPSGDFAIPNPKYQAWAQARAAYGWIDGTELTEEKFLAAINGISTEHTYR